MGRNDASSPESRIPTVELRVTGELCAPALPGLEAAVAEVLAVRPNVLVLDLSQCPLIDADGIGLLRDLHRRLRRDRSRLTVRAPTPQVRRILHVARVEHVLDVVPARDPGRSSIEPEPAGGRPGPQPVQPFAPGLFDATHQSARRVHTITDQGGLL